MNKIEISPIEAEVVIESLTFTFLKTGVKKYKKLADRLMNEKIKELFNEQKTNTNT